MVRYLLIGNIGAKSYDNIEIFETGCGCGLCGQRHDGTLLDIMPDFF
jgi:hypothetical protein